MYVYANVVRICEKRDVYWVHELNTYCHHKHNVFVLHAALLLFIWIQNQRQRSARIYLVPSVRAHNVKIVKYGTT